MQIRREARTQAGEGLQASQQAPGFSVQNLLLGEVPPFDGVVCEPWEPELGAWAPPDGALDDCC